MKQRRPKSCSGRWGKTHRTVFTEDRHSDIRPTIVDTEPAHSHRPQYPFQRIGAQAAAITSIDGLPGHAGLLAGRQGAWLFTVMLVT